MLSWVGEKQLEFLYRVELMYEMDPVTQLQPRVRPMFQEKHLICIFLGFVNTWKPEAVCSKEVITDGWSEEHRVSRFISPPSAWGSTSSLSTHQSLQKSFITSSNASSSLKPESLSALIHSCLEFIVVWLSLVLLLCSSLSSHLTPSSILGDPNGVWTAAGCSRCEQPQRKSKSQWNPMWKPRQAVESKLRKVEEKM